jgi:ribonuclease T2
MRRLVCSAMMLWAALRVLAPVPATAQQPAPPGQFDYYLLSLSWSPQFCAGSAGKTSPECSGERHFSFIAHGLWPQFDRGGYPSRCPSRDKLDNATVDAQLDIMPSAGLVRHEWATHGVCSGMGALAFFAELRQAYQRVVLPDFYQRPTGKLSRVPAQLKQEMHAANPWLPENAMTVICDGQYLEELRICLDKSLNPRACGADVVRAACREREFIVRPVR